MAQGQTKAARATKAEPRARAPAARRSADVAAPWRLVAVAAVGGGRRRLLRLYRAAAELPRGKFAGPRATSTSRLADRRRTCPTTPIRRPRGPHLPYIAPWGIHTGRSRRSCRCTTWRTAAWWCSQRPECPDLVEKLQRDRRRYEKHVLLAPYPGMRTAHRADRVDAARRVRRVRRGAASCGSSRRTAGSITTSGEHGPHRRSARSGGGSRLVASVGCAARTWPRVLPAAATASEIDAPYDADVARARPRAARARTCRSGRWPGLRA